MELIVVPFLSLLHLLLPIACTPRLVLASAEPHINMATNAAGADAPLSHKLAKGAVEQLGGPVQSFEPVNQICQVSIMSYEVVDHLS